MPDKADILKDWFDRIWTAGDVDAIPEFLADDATSKGILPDMAVVSTDMPDLVQLMRTHLGGIDVRLAKTMHEGDWVTALLEVRGHVAETGDPLHVFGQIMVRFEGDKMVEMYHSFDFLSFFEQMGQLPANALAVLLAGTRLQ